LFTISRNHLILQITILLYKKHYRKELKMLPPNPQSMGALPPEDAIYQLGDRADKRCVIAALESLAGASEINYLTVQAAIDAYLREAEKHGWKFS
jgi:hypothetical protein